LGLPEPTFAPEPEDSAGKLVDGSRIVKELGFEYQYPDPERMPLN